MTRDDKPIVPWRFIYFGLAFGWLSQVALIAMWITEGGFMFPALSAMNVLLFYPGLTWFIRQRQKGRL